MSYPCFLVVLFRRLEHTHTQNSTIREHTCIVAHRRKGFLITTNELFILLFSRESMMPHRKLRLRTDASSSNVCKPIPELIRCELCETPNHLWGPEKLKQHVNDVHRKPEPNNSEEKAPSVVSSSNTPDHPDESHKCKLCGPPKDYETPDGLRLHDETVHQGIRYTCNQCSRKFTQMVSLRHHTNDYHGKFSPYKCPDCSSSFSMRRQLTVHVKTLHPRRNCSECSRSFSRREHLTDHINAIHHKLRPFQCLHCHKTFTQKSTLTRHINTAHNKFKPFHCQECSRPFARKSDLTRHIKTLHRKLK